MTPSRSIEIAPITRAAEWRALLVRAGAVALEQGWAYGAAMRDRHGLAVERLALRLDGAPCALVQIFHRRVLGIGRLMRIVRGPAWIGELDRAAMRTVLAALRAHCAPSWRHVLLWMPELPEGDAAHALMRGVGLRRVVTGYSSVWLDLGPDEAALRAELDGNWRNALGAAERAGLTVSPCRDAASVDLQLASYDSFRRTRRFIGPPGELLRALIEAAGPREAALVLGANDGGRDVAGIVLLRHGAAATYHAGWTSERGRQSNAHNLLLWRGLCDLRAAGVRWLDLGGVSATAPGVARFKLGLGGSFFTLAGTYI